MSNTGRTEAPDIIVSSFYNQEQKEKYLDYETNRSNSERKNCSNIQSMKNYFKRIREKEAEYKKDIAEMSFDEANDTVASLNIYREDTRVQCISRLRDYYNWAKANGLAKDNGIELINSTSTSNVEVIKMQMIGSPKHLCDILDVSLDSTIFINRSKQVSLLVWLLYSGVEFEDIAHLKKESLDIESQNVSTKSGQIVILDDHVVVLWRMVSDMLFVEKERRNHKIVEIELNKNSYLFRKQLKKEESYSEEACSEQTLRYMVKKLRQITTRQ